MRSFIRLATAIVTLVGVVAAPAIAQETITVPPCEFDLRCPIIRPDSPVVIERYNVDVKIDSQIATTHITQVLRNDASWLAEGIFLHPLPPGATVSDLTLWIDNEPIGADLLPRDEARKIYQSIVNEIRDPALLEWVGRDLIQLSVFPIPPGETRKVELEYSQVLASDAGLIKYSHPLGSEHGSTAVIENLEVRIEASSSAPIRSVYSPTHLMSILRQDDDSFVAEFSADDVREPTDLALFYSVSEDDIGIDIISYRDGDDPAGFFVMLVNPSLDEDTAPVAKDVILVLDRSGSMEGEKFEQAQQAAEFVLDHLNEDDRFNVVTFSSSIRSFGPVLQASTEAAAAAKWVDRRVAEGSTDINRALLEAFSQADDERPTYVIFLTDGLPTEGATDTDKILNNAANGAPRNVSLFSFGVGFDVDTFLLDSLADEHHGTSSYVFPGEEIDEVVSGFFAKVTSPVLTQIEIDFGDAGVLDIHPADLPDLFADEQLIVTGRYLEPGSTSVRLSGFVGTSVETFTYNNVRFRSQGGEDFVPALWATRKIGDLLRALRLEGTNPETVEQIVALATRYGIVTPYTSFLVTEPGMLDGRRLREESEALTQEMNDVLRSTSGEGAVSFSDFAGNLSSAATAPAATIADDGYAGFDEPAVALRTLGAAAFRLVNGVWVDTAYDPALMDTVRVAFLSDEYFRLAEASESLAEAMALGDRVVAVEGGTAWEVVASTEDSDDFDPPTTTTQATSGTTTSTRPAAVVATGAGPEAGGPDAPSANDGGVGWELPLTIGLGVLVIGLVASLNIRRRRG